MDPNATLDRIIEAAIHGNPDELEEAAEDLAEWIDKGGFLPDDPRGDAA